MPQGFPLKYLIVWLILILKKILKWLHLLIDLDKIINKLIHLVIY